MAGWIEQVKAAYAEKRTGTERAKITGHPEHDFRVHISSTGGTAPDVIGPSELQDFEDYASVYGSHTWVRRAVQLIQDNVSKLRVVVKDENHEILEEHVLTKLFAYVNDSHGQSDAWRSWCATMLLGGEAFFEVNYNEDGSPLELWDRRPDRVGVIPDASRPTYPAIAGFTFGDVEYDREDFINWKFDNPLNPFRGLSLVGAVRAGIIIDVFAQTWSRTFLKEGGRPDWALVAPRGTTKTERGDLEFKLDRKFRGFENWHKPIVLEEGVYDIKVLSFPPADMQWLEQRKVAQDEIAAIFGVPDILMGFGNDSYDTDEKREAAMRTFWMLTLLPLIQHRDNGLQNFFAKVKPGYLEPGEYITTDLSDVVEIQEDVASAKIPLIDTLWAKGVSLNEIIDALELDLPHFKAGDVGYLPFNVYPVTADFAEREAPSGNEPSGDDAETEPETEPEELPEPEGEEAEGVVGEGVETEPETEAAAAEPEVVRDSPNLRLKAGGVPEYGSLIHRALVQRHMQLQTPFVDRTQKLAGRLLQDQQLDLNRVIRELPVAQTGEHDPADPDSPDAEAIVWPAFDSLWDIEAENERWVEPLLPIIAALFAIVGPYALDLLPIPVDPFNPADPFIEQSILIICQQHAANLNNTTWTQIVPVLQEAERRGWGIPKTTSALSEYWDGRKSRYQRERIARTMLNGAANDASVKAWDQSGVVPYHQWLSALVPETRDAHKIAHGQEQPLNGWFDVDGELMRYPGDPNASAGNICNCLCATVPVTVPIEAVG